MDPDTEQMKVFETATNLFELVTRESGRSWSQYTQGSEEARDDILRRHPDFPRYLIAMALGRGYGRIEGEERERYRRASLSPLRTSSGSTWNIMFEQIEQIWLGRVGQILAAVVFVMVLAWSAFWGGVHYRTLQELESSLGDRAYQACLAEARTSAELSGAANMIEEPCRRQQAMVQAKVVSIFRGYVWQEPLDNLIKGTFIWFSLCAIIAFIRFFAGEAQVLFPRLR
jgi:hypothetical protein